MKMNEKFSQEEISKINQERKSSDDELLKNGAEYKFQDGGAVRLEITGQQLETILKERNREDEEVFKLFIDKLVEYYKHGACDENLIILNLNHVISTMDLLPEEEALLRNKLQKEYGGFEKMCEVADLVNDKKDEIYKKEVAKKAIDEKERVSRLSINDRFAEDVINSSSLDGFLDVLKKYKKHEDSDASLNELQMSRNFQQLLNLDSDVSVLDIPEKYNLQRKARLFIVGLILRASSIDDLEKIVKNKMKDLNSLAIEKLLRDLEYIKRGNFIEATRTSSSYAVIKKANEIMGLSRNIEPKYPVTPAPGGYVRGRVVQGGKGGPGVVQTKQGKINIKKVF